MIIRRSPSIWDKHGQPLLLALTIIISIFTITVLYTTTVDGTLVPSKFFWYFIGVISGLVCPPFLLLSYGHHREWLFTGVISLGYGSFWTLFEVLRSGYFFVPVIRGWMVGGLFIITGLASLVLQYSGKVKQSRFYEAIEVQFRKVMIVTSLCMIGLLGSTLIGLLLSKTS